MGTEWFYKTRTLTFYIYFALVCSVLLNGQEISRAVTVPSTGFQYWGFGPRSKCLLSCQLPCGTGERTDDQGLRIGAPPKAVTLLRLPQPASQCHPTVNLRWRAPASQLNPIQHDILTKDAEGDGSCEDHQHNSNSKLNQQANKWAVILSGGNRNQRSY